MIMKATIKRTIREHGFAVICPMEARYKDFKPLPWARNYDLVYAFVNDYHIVSRRSAIAEAVQAAQGNVMAMECSFAEE